MANTLLGDKPIGSLIKVSVENDNQNFIVVNHGRPSDDYDVSFDDGVVVLMERVYRTPQQWGLVNNNNYELSLIYPWLHDVFYYLID